MDSSSRWMLTVMGMFVASPLCFMVGLSGLGHGESVSAGRWVFLIGSNAIAAGLIWAMTGFLELMCDTGTCRDTTARDREYYNIRAGYRVQGLGNLPELPWGYRRMEEEYVGKYGTSDRLG